MAPNRDLSAPPIDLTGRRAVVTGGSNRHRSADLGIDPPASSVLADLRLES